MTKLIKALIGFTITLGLSGLGVLALWMNLQPVFQGNSPIDFWAALGLTLMVWIMMLVPLGIYSNTPAKEAPVATDKQREHVDTLP